MGKYQFFIWKMDGTKRTMPIFKTCFLVLLIHKNQFINCIMFLLPKPQERETTRSRKSGDTQ